MQRNRNGDIIVKTHNKVALQTDPTAHAEVTAIREVRKSDIRAKVEAFAIFPALWNGKVLLSSVIFTCGTENNVVFGRQVRNLGHMI